MMWLVGGREIGCCKVRESDDDVNILSACPVSEGASLDSTSGVLKWGDQNINTTTLQSAPLQSLRGDC
jgi:hypothetical protein